MKNFLIHALILFIFFGCQKNKVERDEFLFQNDEDSNKTSVDNDPTIDNDIDDEDANPDINTPPLDNDITDEDTNPDTDATPENPCDPNPCTDTNKTICKTVNSEFECLCDSGYYPDKERCITKWLTVEVSEEHSCGIDSASNNLYCWGKAQGTFRKNFTGNEYENRPFKISDKNFISLALSDYNICAIEKGTNKLYCLGDNEYNQLGEYVEKVDGNIPKLSFNLTLVYDKPIKMVAIGPSFISFIDSNNYLYCLGSNEDSTCGLPFDYNDPDSIIFNKPKKISDIKFETISSGYTGSCAISTDKFLYCWGENYKGMMGQDLNIDTTTIKKVGEDKWLKIAAPNAGITCGIKEDEHLYCMGSNKNHQFLDGMAVMSEIPVKITDDKYIDVDTKYHTCAIKKEDKHLYCFGNTLERPLNKNTMTNKLPYTKVLDVQVSGVKAGYNNTVVRKDNSNDFYFIGTNSSSKANVNELATSSKLIKVDDRKFIDVASSENLNCAIGEDNYLYCSGVNNLLKDNYYFYDKEDHFEKVSEIKFKSLLSNYNVLLAFTDPNEHLFGYGELIEYFVDLSPPPMFTNKFSQKEVFGFKEITKDTYKKISLGFKHGCYLDKETNLLYCRGSNKYGQIGMENIGYGSDYFEYRLVDNTKTFIDLSCGSNNTCVIDNNYDIFCMGRNRNQFISTTNSEENINHLTKIASDKKFKRIFTSYDTACAIEKESDDVYCWGNNGSGTVGIGSDDIFVTSPNNINIKATQLIATSNSFCLIEKETNYLYCWGNAKSLIDGPIPEDAIKSSSDTLIRPIKVSNKKFKKLSFQNTHGCAIEKNTNDLYCFSNYFNGTLGNDFYFIDDFMLINTLK
jgi:alpha-tubulin suppressor-like RCC1 family protein